MGKGTSKRVDDPPGSAAHHHDLRGEVDRLRHGVGDEESGELLLGEESDQLVVEPLAGDLVERAERLVEQEQLRVEGE